MESHPLANGGRDPGLAFMLGGLPEMDELERTWP